MSLRPLLALASLSLIGAAQAPATPAPPPPSPDARLLSVRDVMRHIVNPAAELYWKAAGEEDTAEGAKHRVPTPEDAARWTAVENAAAVLQESGMLLQVPGRARDGDVWMRLSVKLTDAGVQALSAARSRDEAKVFEAGSALYDACFQCHGKYIPRPANSLYKQRLPDDAFKPPT